MIKNNTKILRKVLACFLLTILLVILGLLSFVLLGKGKAINLELKGISLQTAEEGVHSGSYQGFRWSNEVQVTVKDHAITDIRVVKAQVFAKEETIRELIERVLSKQSTKVDIVSGATADSKAFLIAIENALN